MYASADILITVGDLDRLALKVADVGFEAVALSHLNGEKVMIVPLNLPARCVLGKECFRHFLEVAKRG